MARLAHARRRAGQPRPNQALHLPGAALLVSRDIKLLQRPRQVSLVVRERNHLKEDEMRIRWIVATVVSLLLTGCAGMQTLPTPEERQALAPTGKLRAAFLANQPIHATKDPATGELKGVAIDLGRDLARRLQVPFEPVTYPTVVAMMGSAKSGDWDIIFTALDYPHLPLTNNEAERALRHWVILRRISYGTRTEQGSRIFAILASVIETSDTQTSRSLSVL